MKYKERIQNGIKLLANPKDGFIQMQKRTFEDVLEDYMKLLLLSGILAGLLSLIINVATALYLDYFKNITIDYYRLWNYSFGTTTNIFFLYIFIGTLIVSFIGFIVKIFSKLKYVKSMSILLYSLTPVLLFGWISGFASLALLIWSTFLVFSGVNVVKNSKK